MGVNIGHGDKRVLDAIARQAETPALHLTLHDVRDAARAWASKLAELWPGDMEKSFFTLGGAECNENAVRIAKAYTGRQKVLARYRSYHGATYATINLTGDPRRWANEEPPMPGVVHVLDPVPRARSAGTDDADTALGCCARRSSSKDPRRSRRSSWSPSPGRTASCSRPTATSRASASSARSSAS